VCVEIYTNINIYTHTYTYTWIYKYIHTYIYIYIYKYADTQRHIGKCSICIHLHINMDIHKSIYKHINSHINMNIYMDIKYTQYIKQVIPASIFSMLFLNTHIHTHAHTHTHTHIYIARYGNVCTGWRRPIGCLKLQVIFRKRATNYRALLRKITYKDKASYGSSPPCTYTQAHPLSLFLSHTNTQSTSPISHRHSTWKIVGVLLPEYCTAMERLVVVDMNARSTPPIQPSSSGS